MPRGVSRPRAFASSRLCLLLLLAAACGGSPPEVLSLSRDSAGIRIVESRAPKAPDSVAFLVDSVPVLDLGGNGDPHAEFGQVRSATLLAGHVIVGDGAAMELRMFDTTGAWIRSLGRQGDGPGEFSGMGAVHVIAPDTLAVYDWNHRRISWFTAKGDLVRETALPQTGTAFPTLVGLLTGGGLVIQLQAVAGTRGAQSGVRRDSVPVLRYDLGSSEADTILVLPGTDIYEDVNASGGLTRTVMSTVLPFGKSLSLLVAGNSLFAGTGDTYQIARYDSAGHLTRLVRRHQLPVPVTDRDIAQVKASRLDGFRPGQEILRDRMRSILDRIAFPATKPAYESFLVGDDGALWVAEYSRPDRTLPARYDIFDPEGQWLGHATFPPRFALFQAGPGYALGGWKDGDDVDHVRLYHLRPAHP